jgi:ABC-type multidrug transport system ATPase subunit
LKNNDEIQIGVGGPILYFQNSSKVEQKIEIAEISPKTMVVSAGNFSQKIKTAEFDNPQLLKQFSFDQKQILSIGRAEENDIKIDGLQISNHHARLTKTNNGISVEDLGSTNGTYLNGKRISKSVITPNDAIQIGSYQLKISQSGKIGIFDTRSKTRIDAVNITKEVKNRAGGGKIRLLDEVSISIQPNEFIGLLGPSGAGKSTFMDALNGMRPASSGNVLVNNLDLYQHLDSLKQSIGYVPQDDIMHRELTVYRTLYYVAKLRLSSDVSGKEIEQIIAEVLDVTGLSERRNVPINQLSGGQRKRVSIAIELITKPSAIFLDEPTSGLDPATEEKIMKLFRQISESGRTVILTTHAMENVKLFDKIVVLMRGKLVFYGKPEEALSHFKSNSFKDLYDKLESPIEEKIKQNPSANRHQITEEVAENWKQQFMRTSQYQTNVYQPLKDVGNKQSSGVQKKRRLGIFGTIRQTINLSRRYLEVLLRDKFNLFILLAQAPIVALLTFLVMDNNYPRDMIYFVLSLVAIWFGTSVAAREIIRERPVYTRERMVNLGLFPYLSSKFLVLGFIVCLQCFLLFVPLKLLDLIGLMKMQGELVGIPQFWAMILTAGVGLAIGLFVSATVKTSEMATSLVPLILIPQILFSGLIGVPTGFSKVVGLTMPATWSFDTMKRFSTLDTLKEEGSDERSENLGLYKFIEKKNDKIIADTKKDIDDYKKDAEDKISESMRSNQIPTLDNPPKPKDAVKFPTDLSEYVNFLHPWMHEVLNQIVLMLMFLSLCILTLIVLKLQDIN